MEEIKQDYYSVGSVEDIVISNSSLSAINPEQGGSPQLFLDFFREDVERKTSVQMDRGSLLHLWHEDSKKLEGDKQFIIADIEKPSDMMASWCERVFSMVSSSGASHENCADEVIHATREGAYKNIKDDKKLIQKFEDEGRTYYNFLVESNGKIALTAETKRILEGQTSSILGHDRANKALFGVMPEKAERFIEEEVYWNVAINASQLDGEDKSFIIKFKAKLDNIVVRWDKKIVYINDLKTTSKPLSLFKRAFVNYKYYRQLAFYCEAICQLLASKGVSVEDLVNWKFVPRIIAVDNTKFFNAGLFTIDAKWQEKGVQEHRALTERVIWHIVTGVWGKTPEEHENGGELQITFNERDESLNSILID